MPLAEPPREGTGRDEDKSHAVEAQLAAQFRDRVEAIKRVTSRRDSPRGEGGDRYPPAVFVF